MATPSFLQSVNGNDNLTVEDGPKDTTCIEDEIKSERTNHSFPNDIVFREVTSDTISSVSILGKRIIRQYASEFILPDDTKVAVSRSESTQPSDAQEDITLSLCIAIHSDSHKPTGATKRTKASEDVKSSSDEVTKAFEQAYNGRCVNNGDFGHHSVNAADGKISTCPLAKSFHSRSKLLEQCPPGLQIADYMHDDPWAAAMLVCDSSVSIDLLRQLEVGCHLEPEAYRMERIQRRRNWETVIDVHSEPTVRSIGLSRTQSETDSIVTLCTNVGDEEFC